MTDALVIALAQTNPTVGAIDANLAKIREARARAASQGADLVVFTELVITGYPPEDLILKPMFQDAAGAAIEQLAADTGDGGPALLLGAPWRADGKLHNSVFLLDGGVIAERRDKHNLPNYGVFDEKRVFDAGFLPGPMPFRGLRLGAMICEDMWTSEIAECLDECGADIFIVINGSPFESDKTDARLNLAVARVTQTRRPLIYVNQVGGQDELVFDGASFVLNADCWLACRLPAFEEALALTRWAADEKRRLDLRARTAGSPARAFGSDLLRHGAGLARLCRQERVSRRVGRHVGRH